MGFWPTFDGARYLVAALGGLVLGMALGVLGTLFRWGILLLTGATVIVYFLFGGALALPNTTVAGVVPTLETLRLLALGTFMSWKQLLTTIAPVATDDGHLIVPFILALVAAVLTTSLALRLRSAAWSLIPAAAFLAIEIALGTSEPFVPVVQGVVFGLVAVVWLALRQAWQPQAAADLGRRRLGELGRGHPPGAVGCGGRRHRRRRRHRHERLRGTDVAPLRPA